MKENSIEETKKQLELILKVRKEHKEIIECAGGSCINCDPDIKALTESIDILSDYKRVLEMNEVLLKENEILLKENEELKKNYINVRDNVNTTFCKVAIPPEPQLPTKTLCESFSKKVRNK